MVWSSFSKGLFCFPCYLFGDTISSGDVCDNWKKLYELVRSHENNINHLSAYVKWKDLESFVRKHTGVDSALQRQIEAETAKWRKILKCCQDVTLYLAERNLLFRGTSLMIGDHGNSLFLGTLELLSKHNKVLK